MLPVVVVAAVLSVASVRLIVGHLFDSRETLLGDPAGMTDLFRKAGVIFSPCRQYRYTLRRDWGVGRGTLMFLIEENAAHTLSFHREG
jgi:hypothetical protein